MYAPPAPIKVEAIEIPAAFRICKVVPTVAVPVIRGWRTLVRLLPGGPVISAARIVGVAGVGGGVARIVKVREGPSGPWFPAASVALAENV